MPVSVRNLSVFLFAAFLALAALSPVNAQYTARSRGVDADLLDTHDRFLSLDLNGDGKSDLLYYRPGSGTARAYISHGDGTFRKVSYTEGGVSHGGFIGDLSSTSDRFVALDLNGDGKSDFILYRPGGGYTIACLSVGDGSVNCKYLSTPSGKSFGFQDDMRQGDERIIAGSFNADGRQDFIVYSPAGGFAEQYLSQADGTLVEVVLANNGAANPSSGFADNMNASDLSIVPLDVNHDGYTDLMVQSAQDREVRLYLNNQNNTYTLYNLAYGGQNNFGFAGNGSDSNEHLMALDLNGDGRSDFLWWQAGSGVITGYLQRQWHVHCGSVPEQQRGHERLRHPLQLHLR